MNLLILLIVIAFALVLVKNISEWSHNNQQPQIPAQAAVISKRTQTHHHNHDGHMHVDHTYYVTFEYPDGERLEARVPHRTYRDMQEGARGTLTMQGSRFISFTTG